MGGIMSNSVSRDKQTPGGAPSSVATPRTLDWLAPGPLRTLPFRRLTLDVIRDGREAFMTPSRLRTPLTGPAATDAPGDAGAHPTTLDDLIGIEHSKLGFYQELRQKVEELQEAHQESELRRQEIAAILDGITDIMTPAPPGTTPPPWTPCGT